MSWNTSGPPSDAERATDAALAGRPVRAGGRPGRPDDRPGRPRGGAPVAPAGAGSHGRPCGTFTGRACGALVQAAKRGRRHRRPGSHTSDVRPVRYSRPSRARRPAGPRRGPGPGRPRSPSSGERRFIRSLQAPEQAPGSRRATRHRALLPIAWSGPRGRRRRLAEASVNISAATPSARISGVGSAVPRRAGPGGAAGAVRPAGARTLRAAPAGARGRLEDLACPPPRPARAPQAATSGAVRDASSALSCGGRCPAGRADVDPARRTPPRCRTIGRGGAPTTAPVSA